MSLVDLPVAPPAVAGDLSGSEVGLADSSESSSIGRPDDDDDASDGDDDEVQSTLSLGSLEDSLPIKRGLSKFYAGKSKSFGNLGEVKSVGEMAKSESPFNKRRRRRTLMAYNLKKKKSAAFYSHSNHISMPLLPLTEAAGEDHEDHEDEDDYGSSDDFSPSSYPSPFLPSIPAIPNIIKSNLCHDAKV